MNVGMASRARRFYVLVGACLALSLLITAIAVVLMSRGKTSDTIRLIDCAGPGDAVAQVQITNNSDKQTTYFVDIQFSDGSIEKAVAIVDPGRTEIATAPVFHRLTEPLTCQLGNIERRYGTVAG